MPGSHVLGGAAGSQSGWDKRADSMFLDHVWLCFAVLLIVVLFKHRYEVLSEEEAGEEVYEVPIIQVS